MSTRKERFRRSSKKGDFGNSRLSGLGGFLPMYHAPYPCIMHVTGYNLQWHLALHMHRDIALNGWECMVGKIDIVFGV